MNTDYHIHSDFSGDSDAPMKDMIEKGISLGLKTMCFTEHQDYDYPGKENAFLVDVDAYYNRLMELKDIYRNRIELLFGVELGLQPHLAKRNQDFIKRYPFGFVIGSSHIVNHSDPYYPAYYEGKEEAEAYEEYFRSIIDNIKAFKDYDVYGHIDYVVRYGPNKNKYYSYEKYAYVIDDILRLLIGNGIGIELNTGGFRHGLGHPNPHPDLIKRYRELGGEIITVGSDGHKPEHLAYDFHVVNDLLLSCGYKYYTIFRNRKPEFILL